VIAIDQSIVTYDQSISHLQSQSCGGNKLPITRFISVSKVQPFPLPEHEIRTVHPGKTKPPPFTAPSAAFRSNSMNGSTITLNTVDKIKDVREEISSAEYKGYLREKTHMFQVARAFFLFNNLPWFFALSTF
jgi:hypothetical protein